MNISCFTEEEIDDEDEDEDEDDMTPADLIRKRRREERQSTSSAAKAKGKPLHESAASNKSNCKEKSSRQTISAVSSPRSPLTMSKRLNTQRHAAHIDNQPSDDASCSLLTPLYIPPNDSEDIEYAFPREAYSERLAQCLPGGTLKMISQLSQSITTADGSASSKQSLFKGLRFLITGLSSESEK
jgi:hypothetical protein